MHNASRYEWTGTRKKYCSRPWGEDAPMCPYGVVAAVRGMWGRWPPSLAPLFVGDGSSNVTCCPPLRQPAPPAAMRTSSTHGTRHPGRGQRVVLVHGQPAMRKSKLQAVQSAALHLRSGLGGFRRPVRPRWGAATAPAPPQTAAPCAAGQRWAHQQGRMDWQSAAGADNDGKLQGNRTAGDPASRVCA
jgi:hypothetical protein